MRFRNLVYWIKQILKRKDSGNNLTVSEKMTDGITLWDLMYRNQSPWLSETVQSCNLAATISSEVARLITLELDTKIDGSARADFLNQSYQCFISDIQNHIELACALGGMIFKPYVVGNRIEIDCVSADRFFPTAYNAKDEISAAVFTETKMIDDRLYIRLEKHELNGTTYKITNRAFKQKVYNIDLSMLTGMGNEVPLSEVQDWATLEEECTIKNIEKPLFGYFRVPTANNVDTSSALGISCFARAVEHIKQADEQWSRLLWEFEGSELAVFADEFALNGKDTPKLSQRLFKPLNIGGNNGADFFKEFSPPIRDNSILNGFNAILRRIEFDCGLAYGTLSDINTVDKTATEIKASKQRSYTMICAGQRNLKNALEQLVYAMNIWATLGNLAPVGKYDISFNFGDGVLEDTDKEQQIRLQEVSAGLLRKENYLMWRYGVTEEQAREMLPQTDDVFEGV